MKTAGVDRAEPLGCTGGRNEFLDPRKVCLFGLLLIGLSSSAARADFVLGFGQSNYQVDPGQGFDVSIYLTESGTNILTTDGLSSAGVVLSFNLPAMVSDPAQATQITPNPGVNDVDDFVFTSITPATASQVGTAELMFSIFLSDVLLPESGSSSILLGTFHFIAGSTPGQVTNLSTAISAGGAQFFSGTGQELDSLITTSTAGITVRAAAIPEPLGIVLLSSGLLVQAGWIGILTRRRRV